MESTYRFYFVTCIFYPTSGLAFPLQQMSHSDATERSIGAGSTLVTQSQILDTSGCFQGLHVEDHTAMDPL